jgi:addiction module HigA family antidote
MKAIASRSAAPAAFTEPISCRNFARPSPSREGRAQTEGVRPDQDARAYAGDNAPSWRDLAVELDVLKMTAAELARRLNVPTNRVTEILNGQRAITGDTALRLAHFFGTSAEFWLK